MSLLEVENLRVHFHDAAPDRYAVDGVSFSMEEGDILGLVGESGTGKTVTSMCIGGLLPREKADTEGSITLDGSGDLRLHPEGTEPDSGEGYEHCVPGADDFI